MLATFLQTWAAEYVHALTKYVNRLSHVGIIIIIIIIIPDYDGRVHFLARSAGFIFGRTPI